ncbi:MAG: hypothetical protein ACPGQR_04625, partial [Marinirhabdus sp.]
MPAKRFAALSVVALLACQDFGKLTIVNSLPLSLREISGIEMTPQSPLLWAIADSENEPVVYGYNPNNNQVERTIRLKGTANKDWEDIATSPDGRLFVGDFGNNGNKRKDLVIYHIPPPSTVKKATVKPIATHFSFEDQTEYPPKKKDRNFDVEAFIFANNNFYLFTRNRSSHFNGLTKVYRVPAKTGTYSAKPITTFKTCNNKGACQVTGASVHHPSGQVALLGYDKVWLLSGYKNEAFFKGKVTKIALGHAS